MRTFEQLYKDDGTYSVGKSPTGRRRAKLFYNRLTKSNEGRVAIAAIKDIRTYSHEGSVIQLQVIAGGRHFPEDIRNLGNQIAAALGKKASHHVPAASSWHDYHSANIAWSKKTYIFVR